MQETLKQLLEHTVDSISIFGEDSKFKYEEGGFGGDIYNFELRVIEVRPKPRIIFRKHYIITDHKDEISLGQEFKKDIVRAQFLRELVTYAVGASKYQLDKINEIKR